MEGRRRITLYDQMTAANTSSRDSLASLLFDNVVLDNQKAEAEAAESRELSRSRTLLDIIREDAPNNSTKDRRSWKAFKDKLRLKRASGLASENNINIALSEFSSRGSVSSETRHNLDESTQHNTVREEQQNDVVTDVTESSDPITQVQLSGRSFIQNEASDEVNDQQETGRALPPQDAAAGVSLMDLLEETTDQEMGLEMDLGRMSDDDEVDKFEKHEEEEEEEKEKEGSVVEYNCCVCMVRHKGAAFIPCGHTFCRMCSRELWVSRGNCPLCNNFILEILDIF